MPPVKKILNKLNGLHYRQEYLCFAKGSHTEPLHAYITNDNCIIKDITNLHLFVGYHPLVFAFAADAVLTDDLQLVFSQRSFLPNELFSKKDALAFLDLKIIKKQPGANGDIFYYEGIHGSHSFISRFNQYINRLNNQWYNKKAGNVFLHDNLYKQVQIAYAIPRDISLITVGNNNGLFNLFPTDLHGQVNEDHYIISLRSNGKACEQVTAAGRVLISQVDCDIYKTVYSLGKNHMQALKPMSAFPFGTLLSGELQWPIPDKAISYHELTLQDSFIQGIHKIMLFRIDHSQQLQDKTGSLVHIHNCYASWRHKNKLAGNYLLR